MTEIGTHGLPRLRNRKIYLDLDGVIADFYGTAEYLLGCPYHSLAPTVAWEQLSKIPSLYKNLPLLPGARDFFLELQRRCTELAILTALPWPTGELINAAIDKKTWVRRHISSEVQVLTVEEGKLKASFAHPNAILIDDSRGNIDAWSSVGGIGILHSTPGNSLVALDRLLTKRSGKHKRVPFSNEHQATTNQKQSMGLRFT